MWMLILNVVYVLVAIAIIALSLITRKWHPNIAVMVLGVTAFALAMLPFVWPKNKEA